MCVIVYKNCLGVYKRIGNRFHFNEETEYSDFFTYLSEVRYDYEKESKILSRKLKRYSFFRVILSCSIPVVIILFDENKLVPILISSCMAFIDFLLSFNKLPDKLYDVERAINDIGLEYNLYIEKVGPYKDIDKEKSEQIFKEKIIKLIHLTDSNVTNKYNVENLDSYTNQTQK